jgi:hypothetical protein
MLFTVREAAAKFRDGRLLVTLRAVGYSKLEGR